MSLFHPTMCLLHIHRVFCWRVGPRQWECESCDFKFEALILNPIFFLNIRAFSHYRQPYKGAKPSGDVAKGRHIMTKEDMELCVVILNHQYPEMQLTYNQKPDVKESVGKYIKVKEVSILLEI